MFTIPSFFPFISMIDDEGDNGGSEPDESQEPDFDDLGVPYEEPGEEYQEPQEVKNNPAWDDILNYVPEDKRTEVLPKLKSWDDNFAKVQSDFAPYKPLIEHKIPFEEVQRAFAFANLVNTNPRALYDELGQRFGFGQGQKQVDNNEEEEDQDLEKPDVPDLTKHPEFVKMQQTLQQFEQAAQREAERQENARIEQNMENEFKAIENELKVKLSPTVRAEVINRTIILGDRSGKYDLREGYKDYSSFVSQVRNSRANNTAPRVFSGSGGLPASNKPISQMTDEERAARMVAFLEASNKEP
jgi:hypothetical protein